jgi:hypothetical protein
MNKSDITGAEGVGVFTRGYPDQMKEASQRDDDELTTFRSQQPWTSAKNALEWRNDDVVVYYCPKGGEEVQYKATLEDVFLHPERDDEKTEEFLKTQLSIHEEHDDGLWSGSVKTLYRVSGFRELKDPLPFISLKKLKDGEHIDPDYGYSYSIVKKRTSDY